ncbi:Cof-type HAD-IIB family hydrolase [Priestia flexa]|uniref:Cof-type HAD-IIB family hydrolase n=1 Tax=Priestia flexa TaxID=86664 RepID=A0A8I1MIW1_9BACI|nr:Cof-type HAD-IIB family hydrolase [Priestia flexa]AQX53120.1 hydrolase [Priestia flexa]MBN8253408.1 Cof-type HAD-IIB family hydrolase [Priestia flexa]MDW8517951.1 Cof-type HAD-IIB family hydrolase [Priestia flexa]MED4589154.1 Cof-type HAD-IIB family hydrolase [Priestia flexa]RIV07561.1 Cof-type HAD-IIB family hydrolase [Priestia flexa]
MIKCVATDMDGTLVNSEQKISVENSKAIKAAQREGVEVIVATGRSYEEAAFLLKEAGIETFLICTNGAEVRNKKGEKLEAFGMSLDKIKAVEEVFNKHELYFEVYTSDGTYSNDYDKALSVVMDIYMSASLKNQYDELLKAAKKRFEEGKVKLIEEYEPLFQDSNILIYKMLAFSFDDEKLNRAREELKAFHGIAVSSSGKENIEVNSEEAQKGIALEKFVKSRGISLQETMAIGDNYNDLSMFHKAGRAVAMGNAPDEIKRHAHVVTKTNDEHGVAEAIESIFKPV